ncbi:putative bifunctional diguanylate cyclase/phosphodiesterase [Aquipseudomonas ullengensis]|uniref:cyclic-guanylate-specific phosphodiesterase n=1 Tax=Aquipseudomonas ullengensis TaxID=2759166 RepID=A0A7W4LMD0_9GAMM|nr:bifunctional diguanylate cyclase/phosphodiesterase [Pseudomonas ullengensis]MBB2495799.1 bifunctional diguanylate cyclase/phosphodiesterase [Pseudomonas ullengensis]
MEWLGMGLLFERPETGQLLLDCKHTWGLVLLAYVVACAASYATLSIANRVTHAERAAARRNWMAVGALCLGGGIWSMHFVAMLAFEAPIAIRYDLPTTIISFLVVLTAALLAMKPLGHPKPSLRQCLQAALCIGLGIALMHYIGMAAIRSVATLYYQPALFALSVAIAFFASLAALQLALFFRDHHDLLHELLKLLASLIMGGAIVSMHFTGMWALDMVVPEGTPLSLQSTANSLQLALSVALIALLSIGSGLGAAWADRRLQSKEHDLLRVNSLVRQLDLARASLQKVAHFDPLTNLLNRRAFNELFAERLRSHASTQQMLAVMFFDIDHFKRINDSLGHDAGDELLKVMAERIRSTLRDQDVIARFGGDEFCVLVGMNTQDEARNLAQRIMQRMKEPISLSGRHMVMTTSIGISVFPQDGESCDELLKHADLALYQSKGSGRNSVHFFSSHLKNKASIELELEDELRQALQDDRELLLHYQPILDLCTGEISKLEALVRWQHPRLGLLSPDRFIGIAEANGFIAELDAWVLRRACQELHQLSLCGFPELRVAVNCSALNLSHDDLPEEIELALRGSGIRAQRLELEVTENALMSNVNQALSLLQRIRGLGVSISIDDFGTGYSSLAYLKRLPLDTLKIDRSFLFDIATSNADQQIVQAIIGMAHPLHLKVVAEGVETETQLEFLRSVGCDFIQGYLLSKPLPLAELDTFLVEFRLRSASNVVPLRNG